MSAIFIIFAFLAVFKFTNWLSYHRLKAIVLKRQIWDLNISCGKTDGGGVNADIVQHAELPNFVLTKDIYHLPFTDKQFDNVLCSHTIEHVENPDAFFAELSRVGKQVTLIIPPIWDFAAAFNLLEHRWLFLTCKKEHTKLPPKLRLGFVDFLKRTIKIVYIKA